MSALIYKALIGKVFRKVTGGEGEDEMKFEFENGTGFKFFHVQDCCENVSIRQIDGDLKDLEGAIILQAEAVDGEIPPYDGYNSQTWTFYKFATSKGSVTVTWLGQSNGYYSWSVDFRRIESTGDLYSREFYEDNQSIQPVVE